MAQALVNLSVATLATGFVASRWGPQIRRWLDDRALQSRLDAAPAVGPVIEVSLQAAPLKIPARARTPLHHQLSVANAILSDPAVLGHTLMARRAFQDVSHPMLTQSFLLHPFKPFCCSTWRPAEKLDRIVNHLETVGRLGGILVPGAGVVRTLSDLAALESDYSLRLDEPKWMTKDGLLSLSLWKGIDRVFTISFLLQSDRSGIACYVCGIQGRSGEQMLALYRDMTKEMHGMRPRDFLIELHRMFCAAIGVSRILAVSDAAHYERDSYWDAKSYGGVKQFDLDDVWRDRGGIPLNDDWYSLPLAPSRRAMEEISAKKRGMYRKRYDLLDVIEKEVEQAVRQAAIWQARDWHEGPVAS